jgi:lactam utilization protein B
MRRPARRELGASRSAQRAREGFGSRRLGDDDALLDIVTSANVACGFHAGDPDTLRRVCARTAERDVAIGAQVSYRDLVGFDRQAIDVPAATLTNEVIYEVGALDVFARIAGTSAVRQALAPPGRRGRADHGGEAFADRGYTPAAPWCRVPSQAA